MCSANVETQLALLRGHSMTLQIKRKGNVKVNVNSKRMSGKNVDIVVNGTVMY